MKDNDEQAHNVPLTDVMSLIEDIKDESINKSVKPSHRGRIIALTKAAHARYLRKVLETLYIFFGGSTHQVANH